MFDIPCYNILNARDRIIKSIADVREVYTQHPDDVKAKYDFLYADLSMKLADLEDEIFSNELQMYPGDVKKVKEHFERISRNSNFLKKNALSLECEPDDCALDEYLDIFEDELDNILIKGVCRCLRNPPKGNTSFVGTYSEEGSKRLDNSLSTSLFGPEGEKL